MNIVTILDILFTIGFSSFIAYVTLGRRKKSEVPRSKNEGCGL